MNPFEVNSEPQKSSNLLHPAICANNQLSFAPESEEIGPQSSFSAAC